MYFHRLAVSLLASCAYANNGTVQISSQDTYLLPNSFQAVDSARQGFSGNGTTSEGFVDTTVSNTALNSVFASARNASFISYSTEFDDILGSDPTFSLIESRDALFAFEAAVWVYDRNEVWFTSSIYEPPTTVSVLDLSNNTVRTPQFQGPPVLNPNGGYYWNGQVYFTTFGNTTYPPGIVSIDPNTGNVTNVVDSYFGERFNAPDDVTWVKGVNGATYMYFSDSNYGHVVLRPATNLSLPDAVWRYCPEDESIVPVINRADIEVPNGIRVDATQKVLYITDAPFTFSKVGVGHGTGTPAIYAFDITDQGFLVNKRLVGQPRVGIADGLHIDDRGRIWTGEGEGIVVRSPTGKVLGLFNGPPLLQDGVKHPIAQFSLAGDTLVVLALNNLWSIKLGQTLVNGTRYHS